MVFLTRVKQEMKGFKMPSIKNNISALNAVCCTIQDAVHPQPFHGVFHSNHAQQIAPFKRSLISKCLIIGNTLDSRKPLFYKGLRRFCITTLYYVKLSLSVISLSFFITITQNIPQVFAGQTSSASWYSVEACRYNPTPSCPTASGKSLYQLEADNVLFAAMWGVSFGSRFLVTNQSNGKSVEVVIYDRGPAKRLNRAIDLSKQAFAQIADLDRGLIDVTIEMIQ